MGKAVIKLNKGNGLYSVELKRNKELINKQVDLLDEKLRRIEEFLEKNKDDLVQVNINELLKLKLEKRKEFLLNIINNPIQIDAWSIDLSENLSDEIIVIEIDGQPVKINIAPETSHAVLPSGKRTPVKIMSAAQAAFNFAIHPGWQKHMPTYRTGEITYLNGSYCDVKLDDTSSFYQSLNINKKEELRNISIKYMTCDGIAFSVGDRVIVEFENQDWIDSTVVGFESNPKPCPTGAVIIVSTKSGDEAFAWDITENRLVAGYDTFENVAAYLQAQRLVTGFPEKLVPSETDTHAESFNLEDDCQTFYSLFNTPDLFWGPDLPHWKWFEDQIGYYNVYLTLESVKKAPLPGEFYRWEQEYSIIKNPENSSDYKGSYILSLNTFDSDDFVLPVYYFWHRFFDGEEDGDYWRMPWPDYLDLLVQKYSEHMITHEERTAGWGDYFNGDTSLDDSAIAWAHEYRFWEIWNNYGIGSNEHNYACFEQFCYCADFRDPEWIPAGYEEMYDNYDLPDEQKQCVDDSFNYSEGFPRQYKRFLNIYFKPKYELISGLEAQALSLIRFEREKSGLPELIWNHNLYMAARRHSLDLAENLIATSSHVGTDGSTTADRVADTGWITKKGTLYYDNYVSNGEMSYSSDPEKWDGGRVFECVNITTGNALQGYYDDPASIPDYFYSDILLSAISQSEFSAFGHAEETVAEWLASKIGGDGEITLTGLTHRDGMLADWGRDHPLYFGLSAVMGSDGLIRWTWLVSFRPYIWSGWGPVKTDELCEYADSNFNYENNLDSTRVLDFYLC